MIKKLIENTLKFVSETMPKRTTVVVDGKRTTKYVCPDGYYLKDDRCIKATNKERKNRSNGAKSAKRKTNHLTQVKRQKSMDKRDYYGL